MFSDKIEGDSVRTVETRDDAVDYLLEAIHVHNEKMGIEDIDGGLATVEAKKWGFPTKGGGARGGIVLIIAGKRFRIEVDHG